MISRLYASLLARIVGAPRKALALLALLLLPVVFLDVRYFTEVHAGVQELLPDDAPTIRAATTLVSRFGGGVAGFNVLVRSPSPEENRRFATALGDALRARRHPLIRTLQASVAEERAWVERHAPMLLPRGRFDEIVTEAEGAIEQAEREANPMFIGLEDETAEERLRALRRRLEREREGADRFPDGFIASRDGRTVIVRLTMAAGDTDADAARALVGLVRAEVDRLKPNYRRDLAVVFNGDVPGLIEEQEAVIEDVSLSSVLVMILVGALIVGYYRSARALAVVGLGLLPGVAVTFALARLAGSTLNANSAFLGSIIVGNGINYPLVLLAYYIAQPASKAKLEALRDATRASVPGIAAASATAAAAYGGLAATQFKGFSQFGGVGAVGMIVTAILAYATTPLAIALFDPPRRASESTRAQTFVRQWFAHRARSLAVAGLVAAALVVGAVAGARVGARQGWWDGDLRNLRSTASLVHGAARWDREVSQIFGTWLTPVVALTADAETREALATSLRASLTTPTSMIERVETVSRYLPEEDDQRGRIAALERLKRRVDAIDPARVPADAREVLDRWIRDPSSLRITPQSLPGALRTPFTERDGTMTRTVLVFPSLGVNYDRAENVIAFAARVNGAPKPPGAVVGGAFLVLAEVLRVLRAEAPRVIGAVCLLVSLALLAVFRRRPLRAPVVLIVVALATAAAMLVMRALGVRLNMLNFAAIPISLGVGADYVVNLFGAMDSLRCDAREACARMGGAILLCSLTTIVGYLTLLLASSGALRSFGQAAVLGELCAVLVVLVIYPALAPRSIEGERS
ncbi:MAG: MMPL family transporter [Polyangiales bacterium]